jgi:hypothetical protein
MVISFFNAVFVYVAGVSDSSSKWRFAPNTTCAPEAKRASTPRAPVTLLIVVIGFFNTLFASAAGVTNILFTIYCVISSLHTLKTDTSRTRHRSRWFCGNLLAHQACLAWVECCIDCNEDAAHEVARFVVLRRLGSGAVASRCICINVSLEHCYAIS